MGAKNGFWPSRDMCGNKFLCVLESHKTGKKDDSDIKMLWGTRGVKDHKDFEIYEQQKDLHMYSYRLCQRMEKEPEQNTETG
jgi:hypothetical protein